MKKLILMLLILVFILPMAGKDKHLIFCSPLGGYTLPWAENGKEYINVYLNADGTLNVRRVHEIALEISYHGANSVREFPFWPHPALKVITYGGRGSAWFEDQYFLDWRKIVEIYNLYGITVYLELFDYCGTRKEFGKCNPWNIPLAFEGSQNYNAGNFFWGPESEWLRDIYIKKMVKTLDRLDVGYGVCNEPRLPDVPVKFLIDTFCTLIDLGVPAERIILPIDYRWKKKYQKYAKYYRDFRNGVVKRLKNKKWEQGLKDKCITPVHNCTLEHVKEVLGENPPPGGSRNICFDTDGWKPRPTGRQVKEVFSYIYKKKPQATQKGKIHFAVVYYKQKGDPFSLTDMVKPYRQLFGNWPENYQKYKLNYVEPEPVPQIKITSPYPGETWEPGESHAIAWNSYGSVGDVKIDYSINGGESWTTITPSTKNDGVHPWVVSDIPAGQCLIRVSEVDGPQTDTKGIMITESKPIPKPETEKKGNNVWVFIVAIIAALGVAIYFFINHFVTTALVAAVLLLATTYIGYKKKWKHYYAFLIAAYALILAAGILTNDPILMKALFVGAMGIILVMALIVDRQHKKIKHS